MGGSGMGLKHRCLLVLLAISSVAALLPSPVAAAPTVSLVSWGLDSPRGIAFAGNRALVAEAGHGSNNPADCVGQPCVGNTSQITWINTRTGAHTPLATGFFSVALNPVEKIGVSGLSVRSGKVYGQIGATTREVPGTAAGNLISVKLSDGSRATVAAVGDADYDYTLPFTQPDASCGQCKGRQEHDANPTGVLATSNGWYVADSGSNTLTRVAKNGKITILAYFDWRAEDPMSFPSDEVPTCVTGSGDALWIGTLAGHLFRYEEGKVTQVTPKDNAGNQLLSHVTGCTSRGEGKLYLVNMFGGGRFGTPASFNGNVVQYNTESGKGSVIADAFHNASLFLPYMPSFGPDGNLYVTAGAVCPASGANPFAQPGAPPIPINPCAVGDKTGGRLVKINISQNGHDD
jgi:hypothetical protein